MAFKAGDRVRVLVDEPDGSPLKRDQIVEVQSVEDDGIRTKCGWAMQNEYVSLVNLYLTPTQITELLHEAEHDIFVAEQRKRDLQAALDLVNKGWKVELPE